MILSAAMIMSTEIRVDKVDNRVSKVDKVYLGDREVDRCTKEQRNRLDLKRENNKIDYKKYMKMVSEKFNREIKDLGELSKREARELLKN